MEVIMKIKPTGWEVSGTDFCCQRFKQHAQKGNGITVGSDGHTVYLNGIPIDNCPFCGKKITLEREGC